MIDWNELAVLKMPQYDDRCDYCRKPVPKSEYDPRLGMIHERCWNEQYENTAPIDNKGNLVIDGDGNLVKTWA